MGVSSTLIIHRCATVTEGMNYRWTAKLVEVSENIVIEFIAVTVLNFWTIWVLFVLSTQYDNYQHSYNSSNLMCSLRIQIMHGTLGSDQIN